MKKTLIAIIIIIILLIFSVFTQTQPVPRTLIYECSYLDINDNPLIADSVYFKIYHGDGAVFALLDTTGLLEYDLLQHPALYDDNTHYFYVTTYYLVNQAESVASDTVSDFFPKIIPKPPFNLILED